MFGHESHACPGRFIAMNEIKVLLANMIMNYDWRFKDGIERPQNLFIGTMIAPDPKVEVIFKKRK